ncbi:MAG: NFACT RNA binding domain-containing protein [Cyclobacteriaceae bacterium]|nr:NFACT RNA binding domain-containing protein [Cyclobacteriaceae bacterium]
MYHTFFFVRQLSRELTPRLEGHRLVSCFTQNKDELVLEFNNPARGSFFIKANLEASVSALSFPDAFARARKNSTDLFSAALLAQVVGVRSFDNERSFAIDLSNETSLLFKLHGSRSNIILLEGEKPSALFRNNLMADWELAPANLHRSFALTESGFLANRHQLQAWLFTFDRWIWRALEMNNFHAMPASEQWALLSKTYQQLLAPSDYRVSLVDGKVVLSLLPLSFPDERVFDHALAAANAFVSMIGHKQVFLQQKEAARHAIRSRIRQVDAYLQKSQNRLDELLADRHYQQWADLIMAHLHSIPEGAHIVSLANFYDDNRPVDIRLKPELSPQKNAEVLYRKAKNQAIEKSKLAERMAAKARERETLAQQLAAIEAAADLKNLRQQAPLVSTQQQAEPPLPYHAFECQGFKIWVGKNADHNDTLTFQWGYKEDLWLHAKDVPGSHVLIKHQANKPFPKPVIERAAELAAYNSKRKTDTLCPVIVTPRKYVRKRKGDPPGAVVVEKETVILVEPKL